MKRAWKILGAVVAAVALAIGALALYVWTGESRRWEEMGRLVEDLAVEAGQRESKRPVLRGVPLPGDAWEDYAPPIKAYDDFILAAGKAGSEVQPVIPGWKEGAIAALRRGVRRESARHPYGQDGTRGEGRYPMAAILAMGGEAIEQAATHRASGLLKEASELALDAALFARDVEFNGNFAMQEEATNLIHRAFWVLKEVLLTSKNQRVTPAQMARELEVLDRNLSRSGYAVLNEIAREARALRAGETWEWWERDMGPAGWRYAFSRKLVAADGVRQMVDWIRRTIDDDDIPWQANDRARDRFLWEEAGESRGNGLLEAAVRSEYLWVADGRETHARLHLLRMAAHYLATGEVQELADPYGSRLLQSVEGTRLKAWSIGRKQRNQAGDGDWDELVIEVMR